MRLRRQRADLDEAEAETRETVNRLDALVEPGCETQRIGKGKPERLDPQSRIGVGPHAPRVGGDGANGDPMRDLRRQRA